jgi:hypothetical protein
MRARPASEFAMTRPESVKLGEYRLEIGREELMISCLSV